MASLMGRIRRRLRMLFRSAAVHREMEDELRFHLDMETEQHRRSGLGEDEARRAASLALGGFDRQVERGRDAHGGRELHEFFREFHYALRTLRRSPVLTAAALLTLGLGLGGVTALFTLVDGVLLSPLPFHEPDRLARVGMHRIDGTVDLGPLSPRDFGDLRERTRAFAELAAFSPDRRTLMPAEADPVRVAHVLATANLFSLLGQRPHLGRVFTHADGERGAPAAAVLSHGAWVRHFAADSSVVGRAVRLDDEMVTVVGVLAPGLSVPEDADLWTNYRFGFEIGSRRARWLSAVGRIAPGFTGAAAEADLRAIADRLAEDHPDSNAGWGVTTVALTETIVGSTRPALLLLLGATGLLFVLALANVAGLVVAYGENRSREFSLRGALGAGRWHVVRQLMVEAASLTLLAVTVGVGVALALVEAVVRLAPVDVPRLAEVSLGLPSFALMALAAVPAAAALTLLPARRALRGTAGGSLGRGHAGYDGAAPGLKRGLVAAQVALSTVLLVGGALLARSFTKLVEEDPGFRPGGVVGLELTPPAARYESAADVAEFYGQLVDAVRGLPTVEGAAVASVLPLGPGIDQRLAYTVLERVTSADDEPPMATYRKVSPGFFELLGVELVAGRGIAEADREDQPGVAVVNEALARQAFPGEDPLGRRLAITAGNFGARSAILVGEVEIVGIARDARFVAPGRPAEPELYLSHRQAPFATMHLLVDAGDRPAAALQSVRAALRALDPTLPTGEVSALEDLHARSVGRERFTMLVLLGFAGVALLLASVGVFAVVTSSVARRSSEIAVRQAVGAAPDRVLRMVLAETARLLLVGVGAGVLLAAAAGGALSGLLYGVSATDPATFAGIAVGVFTLGLLAATLPALRTLRVDPAAILR